MQLLPLRLFLFLSILLTACGPHIAGHEDVQPDRVTDAALCVPALDTVAPLQPYTVATLRGSACTNQVVIKRLYMGLGSDPQPHIASVGVDGHFCYDLPLSAPGMYTFEVYAFQNGMMSAHPATASTTYNPAAPAIAGAATCSQTDPRYCNDAGVCCTPNCNGRHCGDDGCGGSCGDCSSGATCNDSTGVCCTPTCAGRTCGSNGCGGTCGTCTTAGETCDATGRCTSSGCGAHPTCGMCTPISPCGWCTRTNTCVVGTETGSSDGTCTGAQWKWLSNTCP